MKNILRLLAFSVFIFGISSCNKAENKDYFEGGTPPALSASTSVVTLESGQEANTALVLNWTNPDYMFTTGISSQDVAYTIEIDTLGGNFNSSNKKILSVPKDLSKTFTVGELNGILGNEMLLQLNPRRDYTIQVRVTASITGITNPTVALPSNVISFTTKPFAPPPKVTPPASGNLYIVGSAISGGWANPLTDPAIQQFTAIGSTDFHLTTAIIGDGEYKLISVNGLWDSDKQWSIATEQASGDPSTLSYDLAPNGGNARAPLQSGTYLIDVNFQTGKVTLTKQ